MAEDIISETVEETPTGSPVETVSEAESPVLEIDQYLDYQIPVKLDGEELKVPLREAIAGYQRQADYTRKTQELAAQREQFQVATALQAALESNPEATLGLLADHYGITRAEAAQLVDEGDDFSSLDPVEQKYRELDQRIASFEELQMQQQIDAEISRLKSLYEDFSPQDVITEALRKNSTDLEGTYKQMAFDRIARQRELDRQAQEALQQKESSVVDAKRKAAVVSGGSSATASTTDEGATPIVSIRDAWEAAKRSHGAQF